eukprot:m.336440 g.336440  ORF g.336440 m.336440 type:complete len:86 (-) comp17852_c0_seq1:91-348(-)
MRAAAFCAVCWSNPLLGFEDRDIGICFVDVAAMGCKDVRFRVNMDRAKWECLTGAKDAIELRDTECKHGITNDGITRLNIIIFES